MFFYTAVQADTTLNYSSSKEGHNSTINMIDGKLRMVSGQERSVSMLYDQKTNTFSIINHDEKSYINFGPKEIEMLGDISQLIMSQVENQLADMPAAQREQMRDMMVSMMKKRMPKQKPAPEYVKTGKTKTVNGYVCEIIIKKNQEKKSGNFCATEYSQLGISAAEYGSIAAFMEIAEKLASQFGQDRSINLSALGQLIPVEYNQSGESGMLKSISHDTVDRSLFSIPKGYRKQDFDLGLSE